MSGFREFNVSAFALDQASSLGLGDDTQAELRRMAREAAPFTHAEGNRRFEGWWLRLEHGEVVAVGRIGVEAPAKDVRTEGQKREAKLRVKAALALHFPRNNATK